MFVQVENSKTRGRPGPGDNEGIVGIVMNSTVTDIQKTEIYPIKYLSVRPAHHLCSEIFVWDIEHLPGSANMI